MADIDVAFPGNFKASLRSAMLGAIDQMSPLQYGASGHGGAANDTAAFVALAAAINADAAWPAGGGHRPGIVDLRGKTYRLTNAVIGFNKNVHLQNGRLLLDKSTIVFGTLDARGSHAISDVVFEYVGTGYYARGLVEIPNAYIANLTNLEVLAGAGSASSRARYGVYMGETKVWGVSVVGGRYYGGDIALRIGKNTDHTGISITGITAEHSRLANVLLCNPAGASVRGNNIEHSDMAGVGLAITHATGGSVDSAHCVSIENNYFFNIANGGGGGKAPAAVLVGYDVPGTTGFDAAGTLITSGSNAQSISIRNNYMVSPNIERAVRIRAQSSVEILNNKWVTDDDTIGFTFEGACLATRIYGNRNQDTGALDLFESLATNRILTETRGGFSPVLQGATSAGAHVYSLRSGSYAVMNGLCWVIGSLAIKTKDAAMAGSLRIPLPLPVAPAQRIQASITAAGFTGTNAADSIQGRVSEADPGRLVLVWQGSSTADVTAAQAGSTPSVQFQLVYPVEMKAR